MSKNTTMSDFADPEFQSARQITSGVHEGESKVITDKEIQTFIPYEDCPGFQLQELFYTEDNLQNLDTRHMDKTYDINLPPGAFCVMKIRMPTQSEVIKGLERSGEAIPDDWVTYNAHATDTIDYLYVLSGSVKYVVDKEIIEVREGDFIAQVGPEHT